MNVLITGGSGFLGTALCNRLVEQGHNVFSLDNFSRKSHINTGLDARVKSLMVDITNMFDDNNNDLSLINNIKFDCIYHLAAVNGTTNFYKYPKKVLDVGVYGIAEIINYAHYHKIDKLISVSTSEVYNTPTQIPTPETERMIITDPHNPRFSYAGGKIISELMTIHSGLNASIIRPHNIYASNAGFEHIIPEAIKKIFNPENPQYIDDKLIINIQGTGNETRAFCYITDFIDGLLIAANAADKTVPIFNIGTENEIKISDLIAIIADILEVKIHIVPGKKLEGSTDRRCPDITKLRRLGYSPKVSLYDGLKKTIDWYKEYLMRQE